MPKGNLTVNFSIYGLFFILGIAVSAAVAVMICKKRNIERYEIVYSGVFAMIGGIVGAKLFYLLISIKRIIEIKPDILSLIRGGFVFYGGLIGGMAGLFIYVKKYKLDVKDFFDIFATVTPLGHAIGRVGCFFGGCCYGVRHDGFPSHIYDSAVGNAPVGVPLLPIQLIEAACLLLLFAAELFAFMKFSGKKGMQSLMYITAYPTVRFATEFFRGDIERGKFGLLSTSQWVSAALILCVIAYGIFSRGKRKNAAEN